MAYEKEERKNANNYTEGSVNCTDYSALRVTKSAPVSGMQSDAYAAAGGDTLALLSVAGAQSLPELGQVPSWEKPQKLAALIALSGEILAMVSRDNP